MLLLTVLIAPCMDTDKSYLCQSKGLNTKEMLPQLSRHFNFPVTVRNLWNKSFLCCVSTCTHTTSVIPKGKGTTILFSAVFFFFLSQGHIFGSTSFSVFSFNKTNSLFVKLLRLRDRQEAETTTSHTYLFCITFIRL